MAAHIKYSVIIPVYNREKKIARCLESLVRRDRNDIQILVIDDGSTDSSAQIIQKLASEYGAIEYHYQENAGVSCARNTGLSYAKGNYITFVDSDDYVMENYFDVLDHCEACDLLVFSHEAAGRAPLDERKLFARLLELEDPADRLLLLLSSRKIMDPWNKRFRRSVIEEWSVRFIRGLSVGEDFNFCTAYAMHCGSIGICAEKIIVNDLSDENSLSRRYRPQLDDQLVTVFENINQTVLKNTRYRNHTAALLTHVDYLFVKHIFSCIAEEYRDGGLSYLRDRQRIAAICGKFRHQISQRRCGVIHWGLRLLLQWRIYWPFYLVTYLVKGRKQRK